jgi:hypothetical protein
MKQKEAAEILGGGVFLLGRAVSAGVADVTLMGIDMTDALYSSYGLVVDWATVVSIGSFAWIWLANMPDVSRLQDDSKLLIGITVGTVLLGTIAPGYASDLGLLGLVVIGVAAGGYWTVKTSCN